MQRETGCPPSQDENCHSPTKIFSLSNFSIRDGTQQEAAATFCPPLEKFCLCACICTQLRFDPACIHSNGSARPWRPGQMFPPACFPQLSCDYQSCLRFIGRPYYRSSLWYTVSSVCLSVCPLSVVCDVLYCGKTVHPSEKLSEGVNRKSGSKS